MKTSWAAINPRGSSSTGRVQWEETRGRQWMQAVASHHRPHTHTHIVLTYHFQSPPGRLDLPDSPRATLESLDQCQACQSATGPIGTLGGEKGGICSRGGAGSSRRYFSADVSSQLFPTRLDPKCCLTRLTPGPASPLVPRACFHTPDCTCCRLPLLSARGSRGTGSCRRLVRRGTATAWKPRCCLFCQKP